MKYHKYSPRYLLPLFRAFALPLFFISFYFIPTEVFFPGLRNHHALQRLYSFDVREKYTADQIQKMSATIIQRLPQTFFLPLVPTPPTNSCRLKCSLIHIHNQLLNLPNAIFWFGFNGVYYVPRGWALLSTLPIHGLLWGFFYLFYSRKSFRLSRRIYLPIEDKHNHDRYAKLCGRVISSETSNGELRLTRADPTYEIIYDKKNRISEIQLWDFDATTSPETMKPHLDALSGYYPRARFSEVCWSANHDYLRLLVDRLPAKVDFFTHLPRLKPWSYWFGVNRDEENVVSSAKDAPHAFIAGTTGAGKTVFINNLLLSLYHSIYSNYKVRPRLIFVSSAGKVMTDYHLLYSNFPDAHFFDASVKKDLHALRDLLSLIKAEALQVIQYAFSKKLLSLPQLYDHNDFTYRPTLMVFDEVSQYLDKPPKYWGKDEKDIQNEIIDTISYFIETGRAAGIRLIFGNQTANKDATQVNIRGNTTHVAAGRVSNPKEFYNALLTDEKSCPVKYDSTFYNGKFVLTTTDFLGVVRVPFIDHQQSSQVSAIEEMFDVVAKLPLLPLSLSSADTTPSPANSTPQAPSPQEDNWSPEYPFEIRNRSPASIPDCDYVTGSFNDTPFNFVVKIGTSPKDVYEKAYKRAFTLDKSKQGGKISSVLKPE